MQKHSSRDSPAINARTSSPSTSSPFRPVSRRRSSNRRRRRARNAAQACHCRCTRGEQPQTTRKNTQERAEKRSDLNPARKPGIEQKNPPTPTIRKKPAATYARTQQARRFTPFSQAHFHFRKSKRKTSTHARTHTPPKIKARTEPRPLKNPQETVTQPPPRFPFPNLYRARPKPQIGENQRGGNGTGITRKAAKKKAGMDGKNENKDIPKDSSALTTRSLPRVRGGRTTTGSFGGEWGGEGRGRRGEARFFDFPQGFSREQKQTLWRERERVERGEAKRRSKRASWWRWWWGGRWPSFFEMRRGWRFCVLHPRFWGFGSLGQVVRGGWGFFAFWTLLWGFGDLRVVESGDRSVDGTLWGLEFVPTLSALSSSFLSQLPVKSSL